MEIARLGVKWELQLLTYTTATATQGLSRICILYHSSQQCQILNPLSEARDRTCILMDTSGIHFCCTTTGTLVFFFLSQLWQFMSFKEFIKEAIGLVGLKFLYFFLITLISVESLSMPCFTFLVLVIFVPFLFVCDQSTFFQKKRKALNAFFVLYCFCFFASPETFGSSWARDQTCATAVTMQILNLWYQQGTPECTDFFLFYFIDFTSIFTVCFLFTLGLFALSLQFLKVGGFETIFFSNIGVQCYKLLCNYCFSCITQILIGSVFIFIQFKMQSNFPFGFSSDP